MARSISKIFNDMSAEKDALSQTANLTPANDSFSALMASIRNNSRVAVWRLWLYIVAVGHWTLEKLFDKHKADVKEMLDTSAKGRVSWIIDWAKRYKDGSSLTVVDGVPQYPSNASGPEIVEFASVRDSGSVISLYVAKSDSSNNRIPLTNAELSRFQEFTKEFRLPGTRYNVISLNPDTILANVDIYYEGLQAESDLQTQVRNAMADHIASLPSKGALDGVLYLIDLVDAIQQVEGVRDIVFNSITGNGNPINRKYQTQSGYANFDKDNSTINMIAV